MTYKKDIFNVNTSEEQEIKAQSVNALYKTEILILHAISTLLLSRKNPYGGKIFWFFKF